MCSDDSVSVPLYARDGSVVAYTLVDADDAALVTQWRWSLKKGYASRCAKVAGRTFETIRLHRFLLGLQRGDKREVDHMNLSKLDNRRSNLRIVTRSQQMQNLPSYAGASSSHRGVGWSKAERKWKAYIRVGGKHQHLGTFATEEEAAETARQARQRLMTHARD